jgi:hypothetical protein
MKIHRAMGGVEMLLRSARGRVDCLYKRVCSDFDNEQAKTTAAKIVIGFTPAPQFLTAAVRRHIRDILAADDARRQAARRAKRKALAKPSRKR